VEVNCAYPALMKVLGLTTFEWGGGGRMGALVDPDVFVSTFCICIWWSC
jgi:hypothetical protein